MTSDERREQNQRHYDLPEVGDYWHERFCPYFIVLAVNPQTGIYVVCDTKIDVDKDSWTFDTPLSKQVTKEYFERVKYDRIDGFVADVVPGHEGFVKDWEHYGCPSIPIKPVTSIEPEKFNYCICHYWSDGTLSYWDDGCVVHYGTRDDANQFLDYVNTKNDYDYKIFDVIEREV